MKICQHCRHADFRQATQKEMKGFLVCAKGEKWAYLNRRAECENNRFEEAEAAAIDKRNKYFGAVE